MTLTCDAHLASFTLFVECCNNFRKIFFTFPHIKFYVITFDLSVNRSRSIRSEFKKNSQKHSCIQGQRSVGSAKEDVFQIFNIYEHGGHEGHVTQTILVTLRSPNPTRPHIKFGNILPSGFRGEVLLKCGRTTTDNGAFPSYKLPQSIWVT